MEAAAPESVSALLELVEFSPDERAQAWSTHAQEFFPGLSILRLPDPLAPGDMARFELGQGTLWRIHSPPVALQYQPPTPAVACLPQPPSFGIVLLLAGGLLAGQSGRECELAAGSLCFLDARLGFRLESKEPTELIMVQMPGPAVLGTHPWLACRTATALLPEGPGTMLLRETVSGLARAAPLLGPPQRASALAGLIELLGVADLPCTAADPGWRIRAALALIELRLADRDLSPRMVAAAQGISRRRLDELFQLALGRPVAAHIWHRRLMRASEFLCDAQHARQSVAQVADANGFEDAAHFARAFKRRYGMTPGQWRDARRAERTP